MGFKDRDAKSKDSWKIANIMGTYNYDQFRFLDGNRNTGHFKKLIKSITEIGVLYQPILVNENYEIVEGQGRFIALKTLKEPILYVVQNGIGIKECRYLNSCSTNWGMNDYVHSYASGEDKKLDYVYLEQLQKEFKDFGIRTIYGAAANRSVVCGGKMASNLKDGNAVITKEDYERGRKVLSYLKMFSFLNKAVQGRIECMHSALVYCYNNEAVDNMYLLEKVNKYYSTIPPIANTSQAVAELERIYNFNIRGGREQVFLKSDYERYTKNIKSRKKGR